MANWERREADTLTDAIDKHRQKNPHLIEDNELLAIVQDTVDDAANTVCSVSSVPQTLPWRESKR
jgi:hypothetical protein